MLYPRWITAEIAGAHSSAGVNPRPWLSITHAPRGTVNTAESSTYHHTNTKESPVFAFAARFQIAWNTAAVRTRPRAAGVMGRV